jgi:ElaB/YqjD/DUF883 family membrane-anchored ribosome-binding protein
MLAPQRPASGAVATGAADRTEAAIVDDNIRRATNSPSTAAAEAGREAQKVGNMAERKIENSMGDVGADLAQLKADLGKLAASVASLVESQGQSAAATVKGRVRAAAATAEDAASRVAEEGRYAYDQTRAAVVNAGDDVSRMVERNPIAALGIALGVGLVIGMMSRRRD